MKRSSVFIRFYLKSSKTGDDYSHIYVRLTIDQCRKAFSINRVVFVEDTILEVAGDAFIRKSIFNHTGTLRIVFGLTGMVLLLGYGVFLNLAPVEFAQVVGLYIATLFVVWQVINYIAFRTLPTLPIIIGGALIITGGLLVTFWKPK